MAPSRRSSGGRRWWSFWGAMGIACLALLVAGIAYDPAIPSPYDLSVLGQSQWNPDARASVHVRLVSHAGGRTVSGAPIAMTLSGTGHDRELRLAETKTGPDGSAALGFRVPEWPDGRYELRITATTDRRPETITRAVKLRRAWRVMLSTDKPIYQPGQVIRLRGLALRRPGLKPLAGREMAFAVIDPRGNVIFRERVTTSDYGIASADCPLATELNEGSYRVECRVGETTSQATVEVKTYVLPRLKVALDLDRPFYAPGELLRGSARAEYVFGKPVRDASATFMIEDAHAEPTTAVGRVETKTDAEGRARFEFRLPDSLVGRAQDNGDARIRITATVRDPAGQTQSQTESRVVSTRPIRIEVVPESGNLVQDVPNAIHFLTSTPDGRPVQTRLSVTGVRQGLKTDALGSATLEFTPRFNHNVSWTIWATDDLGRQGVLEITLGVGQPSGDYLVHVEKAVLRGGEPLRVQVLGGGLEPVFLDLIKDGQTALSTSIPLNEGRGELTLDLPPELSGTIVLCSYRYGEDGLAVRKTRVVQVEPARELTVRTALDRDEYRPGDRARLTIDVTDAQGRPAPGAVSLAAVDEAVFALLDRRPGLERTFFKLEQELLKPVYELHDWSPSALEGVPPADRQRFEQALFARTADRAANGLDELKAALGPNALELEPVLRVLERSDWQELARSRDMPASTIEILQRGGGPHSLSGRTYPAKVQELEAARRELRDWLARGWWIIAAVATVAGLIWVSLHAKSLAHVIYGVLILGLLIGLLLPAVNPAREAGRRTQALNDLRQLDLALTDVPEADKRAEDAAPVRVRQWFPETLLWRPEVITDDQGRARLEVDLADSITTWRLTAGAVAADGRLGGTQAAIRVFQPFFVDVELPVALTRGDEVAVPVVVSNYLDRAQSVVLRLQDASWFERLESVEKSLELAPGEVEAAHYRIRARSVGTFELQVTARGEGEADAVRRTVDVAPNGRRVEQVVSGLLKQPAEVALDTPANAIPGSVKAFVKLYPSSFSQLVEGLDAIFQMPYGCFEQTSSTTYPNVLALDFLRRTSMTAPEVEAKARQYIHLGYQRLLSFEVSGGGFDWFGHPPANRTLTAYGLMEFQDMARVHDVDPNLIERTRKWLLDQQRPDGSWDPEGHGLEGDTALGASSERLARLTTTAYIAWAVFPNRERDSKAQATLKYLQGVRPASIDDPYTLAIVANALLALAPAGDPARPYLERLESLRCTSDDGKHVWWDAASDRLTLFYGGGDGRRVETTALVILALLNANPDPETTRQALDWLVAQKDGRGTWHSTQATVLALKALLAGAGRPIGGEKPRRIVLSLDDKPVEDVAIPASQSDVLRQIDISNRLIHGAHRLRLEERGGSGTGYQVVFRYHVPDEVPAPKDGPLSVQLDYDRTTLTVDDVVSATASLTNTGPAAAPMLVLDLPIPAGFAPLVDDLDGLVASGTVSKYQRTPRQIVMYLRNLAPGRPLTLRYRLRATMPIRVAVPAARAYSYYEPERQGASRPSRLNVSAR